MTAFSRDIADKFVMNPDFPLLLPIDGHSRANLNFLNQAGQQLAAQLRYVPIPLYQRGPVLRRRLPNPESSPVTSSSRRSFSRASASYCGISLAYTPGDTSPLTLSS